MTFTPSATSSFSAGAVFWGMVWATLGKLNELVHFVGFKKSNPRQTVESEIGSFQLTNEQRRWIWEHRDLLTGQIAEVRALTVNESGTIRAGVFVRFHPSKSAQGLLLYSESLAGSTDPDMSRPMMFRLKSSAGWRR